MFSKDAADTVCQLLTEGKSLRHAAREISVSPGTILNWVKADKQFSEQYARAREIGYLLLADEILEISDDGSGDTIETEDGPKINTEFAARSRLRVDSRKWMLSKMLPKIYGDKLDLNHGSDPDRPVKLEFGWVK